MLSRLVWMEPMTSKNNFGPLQRAKNYLYRLAKRTAGTWDGISAELRWNGSYCLCLVCRNVGCVAQSSYVWIFTILLTVKPLHNKQLRPTKTKNLSQVASYEIQSGNKLDQLRQKHGSKSPHLAHKLCMIAFKLRNILLTVSKYATAYQK